MKTIVFAALLGASTLSLGNQPVPTTNATSSSTGNISIQKILISGPPQLKMHSLAILSQGNIEGDIDETYIPGLKICAEDVSAPLRSISAKLLGENFVQNKEAPDQEVITILQRLSTDESSDVRFNAIYYGLTQIKNVTPELAEQLIDIAALERTPELQDRIIVTLVNYKPQVTDILNDKLKGKNAIAYYEIYEEFTGKEPPNTDEFLDMPSSRPHLLIVKSLEKNAEEAKSTLVTSLKEAELNAPSVEISGKGENYMLMLTTHITRDYQTAKKLLSNHGKFSITQDLWLTPEMEIQIESMRSAQ